MCIDRRRRLAIRVCYSASRCRRSAATAKCTQVMFVSAWAGVPDRLSRRHGADGKTSWHVRPREAALSGRTDRWVDWPLCYSSRNIQPSVTRPRPLDRRQAEAFRMFVRLWRVSVSPKTSESEWKKAKKNQLQLSKNFVHAPIFLTTILLN